MAIDTLVVSRAATKTSASGLAFRPCTVLPVRICARVSLFRATPTFAATVVPPGVVDAAAPAQLKSTTVSASTLRAEATTLAVAASCAIALEVSALANAPLAS